MYPAEYVRQLTEEEQATIVAGLRSSDSFTTRRCQILLSSASGKRSGEIVSELHCTAQTVRNAIRAFHEKGIACLSRGSNRPHHITYKIEPTVIESLKGLLHQSPRAYGKPVSFWTLELVAQVAYCEAIISEPVTSEGMRQALKRHGINWKRAKSWITSPDPDYALKKNNETG